MKLNKALQLNKAIRCLDNNRNDEAVTLLQAIIEESQQENELLYRVQAACILGEYWLFQGEDQQAKNLLEEVNNIVITDELDDLLGYEFAHIQEMLNEINKH